MAPIVRRGDLQQPSDRCFRLRPVAQSLLYQCEHHVGGGIQWIAGQGLVASGCVLAERERKLCSKPENAPIVRSEGQGSLELLISRRPVPVVVRVDRPEYGV